MSRVDLSSFPHSLFISSQPGCKAATIRAALFHIHLSQVLFHFHLSQILFHIFLVHVLQLSSTLDGGCPQRKAKKAMRWKMKNAFCLQIKDNS